MTTELSGLIRATIERYYTHRRMANESSSPWNKGEDLDVIFLAAEKESWSVEAMAGTFWFTHKDGTKIHVNEGLLPQGGEVMDADAPTGLGVIAASLEKSGKGICVINANEHGGIKNALKEVITTRLKDEIQGH